MADDFDPNDDPALAEAIARRDESRAQILSNRAVRFGGEPAQRLASDLAARGDEAAQEAARSAAALADIEPVKPDPEGTARPLADSKGNYAANAEVAAVGGTGIKGSNSVGDSDAPATTPEEAGFPVLEGAQKVIADEPVGERATAEEAEEGAESVARKRGRPRKDAD